MKNIQMKKEIWIWVVMMMPVAYLCYVWNSLPEIVPTHFGIDGQPNDWSHKTTLIYLLAGILLGIYALLTVVPAIDPKGKFGGMGNKYYPLKLFMMVFMSVLSLFIIRSAVTKSIGGNALFMLMGALFIFLGNYMQALKPNYFIGIRTPWTLESESVWRKTHLVGGKLFFASGILVIALALVLKETMSVVFAIIAAITALVPIAYSFILYRNEPK